MPKAEEAFRPLQRDQTTLKGAETVATTPVPDANGTGRISPSLLCETSPISWRPPVYVTDDTLDEKETRSVTISVKVTPNEVKFLKEVAQASGMEWPDFLRHQLIGQAQKVGEFQKLFHLVSAELWANRAIFLGVICQFILGKPLTPELVRSITGDADSRKYDRGQDSIEDLLKVLHSS